MSHHQDAFVTNTRLHDVPTITGTVLMIGFCASCSRPVAEHDFLRLHVDGAHRLFCSERCSKHFFMGPR